MNELLPLLLTLTWTFVLAGFVKGVTGMGLPTVAMGLLASFMTPVAAAAFLVVPSLVTNVWQLFAGPALRGLTKRLWPVMVAVAAGTLLSAGYLVYVDPVWSRVALGLTLIVYSIYALVAPVFVVPAYAEKWLGPVLGAITGALTGVTGVFAIPVVPYLQSLGLSKDELVQALGLSFTVSTLALGLGLAMRSGFDVGQLGLSSYAILPALVGMWLGQLIRARISPKGFRICFLLFLLVLGIELCLRALR